MDHRATPEDDLAHRLRAGIGSGDLPAPDLADVQRRADRQARRAAVRTTVVAGVSALAVVGVLAVAVPAISDVVAAREGTSAVLADRPQAPADTSDDLTDPSVWPTLPPVRGGQERYLSAARVDAAVGTDAWTEYLPGMLDPWVARQCTPGPLREEIDADLGPRPSSTHSEPWSSQRARSDGTLIGGFADLAVLRWAGEATGGERAAEGWRRAVLQDLARCPGAESSSGTTLAQDDAPTGDGEPTVIAVAYPPPGAAGSSEGSWSATAILAGGPTALRVHYGGASSAQEAGDAALALLQEGVRAVTTADRAAVGVDSGDRSGGVEDARLADFTDAEGWTALAPLGSITLSSGVPLVTGEDLAAAFPGTRSWQSQPIAGTGTDYLRSWCTERGFVDAQQVPDRPGSAIGGGMRGSGSPSTWEGSSGAPGRPRVDVDVLRWRQHEEAGDAGVDQIALDGADSWGAAIAADASACPGAVALDPAGLPGARATLTAVDDGGRWRVQAIAVGGPTAVRVRATIEADDAAAAGDQAVAMVRRVVANTVRADALEQGRPDPGPLP